MGRIKKYLSKGSGEFLGFAIVAPFLFFLVFFLISEFQITFAEERLIYASYEAGRAAVISYNLEEAQRNGLAKIDDLYGSSSTAASISSLGAGEITFNVDMGTGTWTKGNVVLISVSQNVQTLLPMLSGIRTRQLGMMIEHSEWADEN